MKDLEDLDKIVKQFVAEKKSNLSYEIAGLKPESQAMYLRVTIKACQELLDE